VETWAEWQSEMLGSLLAKRRLSPSVSRRKSRGRGEGLIRRAIDYETLIASSIVRSTE